MTKTKKKLIISFTIIGTIAMLLVLFFCLFSIKSIYVEFVSEPNFISAYTTDNIKSSCKIKKGKNIMFASTGKSIDALEKQFPFASFQIVRTFPSTMTIYVYERKPVFKVLNEQENYEIYDEDLKCLAIFPENNLAENGLDKVPTLTGSNLALCGKEGQFANDEKLKSKLTEIIDGIYGAEQSDICVMSDIIFGFDSTNNFNVLTMKFRTNQEGKDTAGVIEIQGSAYIKEKIFYAMTLYIQISDKQQYRTKLDKLKITALQNFNPNNASTRYLIAAVDGETINP